MSNLTKILSEDPSRFSYVTCIEEGEGGRLLSISYTDTKLSAQTSDCATRTPSVFVADVTHGVCDAVSGAFKKFKKCTTFL